MPTVEGGQSFESKPIARIRETIGLETKPLERSATLLDPRIMLKALSGEKIGDVKKKWNEKLKAKWGEVFTKLLKVNFADRNTVQDFIDRKIHRFETFVEKTPFAQMKTQWLNRTDSLGKAWYAKAADFLVKLPMRISVQLFMMVYNTAKMGVMLIVHPVAGFKGIGDAVIDFAFQLTQPESWTKMGAAIMGAGVTSSLVTGHPIMLPALAVGGMMVLTGVTVGLIKASLDTDQEAISKEMTKQLSGMVMAFSFGLVIGALLGGIHTTGSQFHHGFGGHHQPPMTGGGAAAGFSSA